MADAVAAAGGSGTQTSESTRGDLQQFTGEGLSEIRQLVGNLRELTATLNRMGSDLERNPSMLLYGRPAPWRGPGE